MWIMEDVTKQREIVRQNDFQWFPYSNQLIKWIYVSVLHCNWKNTNDLKLWQQTINLHDDINTTIAIFTLILH